MKMLAADHRVRRTASGLSCTSSVSGFSGVACSMESTIKVNAQLRKIKKPMIERRRRERINECLTQLKSLVLDATNRDEARFAKMEKADILEMTVAHLKAAKLQNSSSQQGVEKTFSHGFHRCLQEVGNYLSTSDDLHRTVQAPLMKHLTTYLEHSMSYHGSTKLTDLNSATGDASLIVSPSNFEPSSSSDVASSSSSSFVTDEHFSSRCNISRENSQEVPSFPRNPAPFRDFPIQDDRIVTNSLCLRTVDPLRIDTSTNFDDKIFHLDKSDSLDTSYRSDNSSIDQNNSTFLCEAVHTSASVYSVYHRSVLKTEEIVKFRLSSCSNSNVWRPW